MDADLGRAAVSFYRMPEQAHISGGITQNIQTDWTRGRAALAAVAMSPLAISEDGINALVQALQASDGTPLKDTRNAELIGNVAIIPVHGPLMAEASFISMIFGASDYQTISSDFQQAMKSEDVKAIVLDLDSPGGNATGCGELSKLIFDARGTKPVIAYVRGACCSAALWVGSAADSMVVDPSAIVGSIGVRTAVVDSSKLQESMGVIRYEIVSSQSPYKVVDASKAEDRQRVTDMVSAMAEVFISDVARNRNVSEKVVLSKFGKGDVLVGQAAVDAGLADFVGDFESVVASLQEAGPQGLAIHANREETGTMAKTNPFTPAAAAPAAEIEAAKDDMKCKGCKGSIGASAYCAKCFKAEDGDEDGDDAKAFRAGVLALVGESDPSKALGMFMGLKAQAGEAEGLKKLLADAKAASETAEANAMIAEACADGRIKGPASKLQVEALLKDHGVSALKGFLAIMKTPATPAVEPGASAGPAPGTPAAAVDATYGLSKTELRVAATIGVTPKDYAAQRAGYLAGFQEMNTKEGE